MTAATDDADVSAMDRLHNGDDLALNEIMDRWQRRVTSYLLRLTGNEAIALDMAQETFVRVYQSRDRYRPTGQFSTWLFTIAANLARQHFRWKRRHPTFSMDTTDEASENGQWSLTEKVAIEAPDPTEAAEKDERAEAVRKAVMSLPDDLREAVMLFEYEELSHEQIARVAGCTPKAVETRLYRARGILRERLQRWLC